MCTCVLRGSEHVCAYVHVQSAFVFRVPGMMGVKSFQTVPVLRARSTAEAAEGETGQGFRKATELSTEFSPQCSRTSFHRSLLAPSR